MKIQFVSHTGRQNCLRELTGTVEGSGLKDILDVIQYPGGWGWEPCLSYIKEPHPLLAEVGSTRIAALAEKGLLVDLTDLYREWNIFANFPYRARISCKWNQKYWAIPFLIDVRLLFYDVKALEDNSIDLGDFKRALQNAADFENFCEEIGPRLDRPIIAFAEEDSMYDLLPWIWSAGGDIVGDYKTIHIHEEATYQGLRRIVRCAFFHRDRNLKQVNDVILAFRRGQVLMVSANFWMSKEVNSKDRIIDVACPPPDLEAATFFGGTHLAIVRQPGENDDSSIYDLPKACLKLLVDPTNNCRFAIQVGHLPAPREAWKQFSHSNNRNRLGVEWPEENLSHLLDTLNYAIFEAKQRVLPSIPEVAPMDDILRQGFKKIWDEIPQYTNVCDEVVKSKLDELDEIIKSKLKEIEVEVERLVGSPVTTIVLHGPNDPIDANPKDYDLFVDEVHSHIFVKGHLLTNVNMNTNPFKVLSALLSAKGSRLTWQEIYSIVWLEDTLHLKVLYKMEEILPLMDEILLLHEPDKVLLEKMQMAASEESPAGRLAWRFVGKRPLPPNVDEQFQQDKRKILADYRQELGSLSRAKRKVETMKSRVQVTIAQLKDKFNAVEAGLGEKIIPSLSEPDASYSTSPDLRVAHVILGE